MLVLKRQLNQAIVLVLPDKREVTIHVNRLARDDCRLAIEAPKDIKIHRLEGRPDQQPSTSN